MPKPYSLDLRKKVCKEASSSNVSRNSVARKFGLNIKTVAAWIKLLEATSSLEPKAGYHRGSRHIIKDFDEFKGFIDENASLTQQELAEKYHKKISQRTVSRGLKKIGYTKKKDFWILRT